MKFLKRLLLLISLVVLQKANAQTRASANLHTLIVFFDGLRPDYITPGQMPNLYAFSKKGCYVTQHHSVFPTVTRVNASAYSTGSYPATNGLMGNTVYFPQVDSTKGLNTGEATEMMKVTEATHDHLLTTISLGEILKENSKDMMVFSSGSSGQAFMQNHKVTGSILNTSMILPDSIRQKVVDEIGPVPANAKPNTKQHIWITDALIKYGLQLNGPLVSAVWFSDPDGSAHSDGIGSPSAVQSIKAVDNEFGRIIRELEIKGLSNNFNIIVSTDHGFATHIGKLGLADFLIKEGFKKTKESTDVVVSEGAVYVKDHDEDKIKKMVIALQAQEWVGAIFTKAKKEGSTAGSIDGTLSFDAIHWNHKNRPADFLVDANWNDSANAAGYKGSSFARGVVGHGSLSPYEVHITLLAAGPSFKKGFNSGLPSSNVDILPTLLHIHQLPVTTNMDGRILYTLLAEKNVMPLLQPRQEVVEASTKFNDGSYRLKLNRIILGKFQYVNFSTIIRTVESDAAKTKQ